MAVDWRQPEYARLIATAMAGVRIVPCPRCNGLGTIGLPTMRIPCPRCRGCGESTINELEVRSDAESD